LALAADAERSIDAQYYLYHNDLIGRLFTKALVGAAERGVRVRLLVDDMALDQGDIGASMLDSLPNVEVRIINPFSRGQFRGLQFLTRFGSVTRRMHNKSFTVDNQVTILGGRNIGNEYFEANPDLAFSDLDILAVGPVVRDASKVFDLYWNSPLAYPVSTLAGDPPDAEEVREKLRHLQDYVAEHRDSEYLQALHDSKLAQSIRERDIHLEWGKAELVYDPPEKLTDDRRGDQTERLVKQVGRHMDQIRQDLIIFSPYFVPGEPGTAALTAMVARGVRVRILTNSPASSDVSAVHAGYSRYRRELLRGGVELYELNDKLDRRQRKLKRGAEGSSKASLHAKSFILDRKTIFIGSMNLDPRSVVENTEVGVVLESPRLATTMADRFDAHIDQIAFRVELAQDQNGTGSLRWIGHKDGVETVYDNEPDTGFWQRFTVGFLKLLPIESQL
jgi:putative cardiolipin synthase